MAGTSHYQDGDDPAGITDINVTPFVDVVLVLLVVFIVTAKLIVSRGIVIEKPKASTGGDVTSTLKVTIKADGSLFVGPDKFDNDDAAIARIAQIAGASDKPKAIVAGDRSAVYGGVMRAIDLVQQAGLKLGTPIPVALENERP